jgi:ribosomal-protein-alanine N-acetyltransferase
VIQDAGILRASRLVAVQIARPLSLPVIPIVSNMKLTLNKSTIRSFLPADAPAIARHIGAYSVSRNLLTVRHPYALQDAEEWIATCARRPVESQFAIVVDGEAVGGIGLDLIDGAPKAVCGHSAEFGYWLGESYWGKGIMTEAAAALAEWAFTELRLVRLQAAVFARNPASARVLEKIGFQFEGRLRARYCRDDQFIDGLLYAKVRLPDDH